MQKAISASIKNIDISLVNTTNLQKEAALVFARNLEKMNDTSIEEFLDFMKKGRVNELFSLHSNTTIKSKY